MQLASEYFPWFIGLLAALNVLLWIWLLIESKARKSSLADYLFNAVRTLSRRSDLAQNMSIDERISFFISDIRDAIESPANKEDARSLLDRLMTKDESRLYLKTHGFEVRYSIARTFIEIFPLLGIVGTVLAIWAGMNTSGMNDADKISRVVQNFSHSVISTGIGLGAGVGADEGQAGLLDLGNELFVLGHEAVTGEDGVVIVVLGDLDDLTDPLDPFLLAGAGVIGHPVDAGGVGQLTQFRGQGVGIHN